MKPIHFSNHALEQMIERGADKNAVIETIRAGEVVPAKQGRQGFRKNFQYNRLWSGRTYAIQQVLAIVAEKPDALIVVTVYTFYF
jgi:predicted N-formylglutamate amidohydrolase